MNKFFLGFFSGIIVLFSILFIHSAFADFNLLAYTASQYYYFEGWLSYSIYIRIVPSILSTLPFYFV